MSILNTVSTVTGRAIVVEPFLGSTITPARENSPQAIAQSSKNILPVVGAAALGIYFLGKVL